MNRNFCVVNGVFFFFAGIEIDVRGTCRLLSVHFRPGASATVEMVWAINSSNQHLSMTFANVDDYIVRGRDFEYPAESGTQLAIAGFSDGVSCSADDMFYVEPTPEMSYMSFVMDDASIFLVKSQSSEIRIV